ncbi:hypothetical protein B0T14DRAFT_592110 [Immersiella caudata]|uniref:Nephrocystin 3-like N-terminal domain-containing protein n=1 Tax=Immersiella caudata TaxID=314043 RepID=A0AA39WEQ7_9PEZI|nr:hypothetical protein B0T14DRAFT_592110 [Immersiella caudata]
MPTSVAYYYFEPDELCVDPCEGRNPPQSILNQLLRSFLRQLCHKTSHIPKAVQDMQRSRDGDECGNISVAALRDDVLFLAKERGQMYLVIDGLDLLLTCLTGDNDGSILNDTFALLDQLTECDAIHVLVSSRDHESDILDCACSERAQRENSWDIRVAGPDHERDILLMIDAELNKAIWAGARQHQPAWLDLIKQNLSKDSNGM